MPTYINSSKGSQYAESITGRVLVAPGGSVETYKILTDSFWTQTAETPYSNAILAHDFLSLESMALEQVAIQAEAKTVQLRNVSGGNAYLWIDSRDNPLAGSLREGQSWKWERNGQGSKLLIQAAHATVQMEVVQLQAGIDFAGED